MNRRYWVIELILLILALTGCQTNPQREELAKDFYNVGNAYFDLGEYTKAVEYYDRALELDPTINQAVFNLARTNIETGNFKKSLKLLSQLEEKDSENIMVLEMIAYTYYRMEQPDSAIEYYRNILDINSYDKRALYNLGLLEKENENWQASRSYLERLTDLEDKPEYRTLLADLAMAEGDSEEAIVLYESLLVDDTGSRDVYRALKDLYVESEQYYSADEMFVKLLKSPEDNKEKGMLFFERSRIEFLYLEDLVHAQEHLIEALKAGYNEKAELDDLLESVDSILKDQVEGIIEEYLQEDKKEDVKN